MRERGGHTFECETCETVVVASDHPDTLVCCGEEMTAVKHDVTINQPDLETLWKDVLGLSRTTILVCICILMDGPTTAKDIAETLDLSQSAVSDHLDPLVRSGIIRKTKRNLRKGGTVNVYTGAPIDTQRQIYRYGLYSWVAEAVGLIERYDFDELKEPYISEATTESQREQVDVFWD